MNTSIYSRWHRRLRVQLNRIDPPTGGPPVYTLTLGDKILQLPGREMHFLLEELYWLMFDEPYKWIEGDPPTPWEPAVDIERRTGYKRRRLRARRTSYVTDRRNPSPLLDRRACQTIGRRYLEPGRRHSD